MRYRTRAAWSAAVATILSAGAAYSQNPIVRGFTPRSGPPGTLVKIVGEHLDRATEVAFAGGSAEFRVVGDTQLKAIVPGNARSGPIRVFAGSDGSATSVPFQVFVEGDVPTLDLAVPRPNPTAGGVTWSFSVPAADRVRLRLFDLRASEVRTLAEGPHQAGVHRGRWDGTDRQGRSVAPGIYFLCLETSGDVRTRRIAVVGH